MKNLAILLSRSTRGRASHCEEEMEVCGSQLCCSHCRRGGAELHRCHCKQQKPQQSQQGGMNQIMVSVEKLLLATVKMATCSRSIMIREKEVASSSCCRLCQQPVLRR